jgi:hypothetical protein
MRSGADPDGGPHDLAIPHLPHSRLAADFLMISIFDHVLSIQEQSILGDYK